ncbi:MAG: thermonuclease family protein [Rickettsiales bacterium]|nr:thermonuclease family protein [Rickettsiales bacterium]
MKNVLHISLASFATLIFSSTNSFAKSTDQCVHDLDKLSCVQYVSNYDGDSFVFEVLNVHPLFGSKFKIDFSEYEAPKIRSKQKCQKLLGKKSKDFAKDNLKSAKKIDLVNVTKTRSGKFKGDVLVDGKSLSEIMLKNKLLIKAGSKDFKWCK